MAKIDTLTEFKKRYRQAIEKDICGKLDLEALACINLKEWMKSLLVLENVEVYFLIPIVPFEQANGNEEASKLCHHSNFGIVYFYKDRSQMNTVDSISEQEKEKLCKGLLNKDWFYKEPSQHITIESDGSWYSNDEYEQEMRTYLMREMLRETA